MSKEHHISQVGKKVDHIGEANRKVKQPEVGDVWLSFLARYLIVGGYNEYAYCVVDETESVGLRNVPYSYLTENCKYLGKSKVSIKELFDVAED